MTTITSYILGSVLGTTIGLGLYVRLALWLERRAIMRKRLAWINSLPKLPSLLPLWMPRKTTELGLGLEPPKDEV